MGCVPIRDKTQHTAFLPRCKAGPDGPRLHCLLRRHSGAPSPCHTQLHPAFCSLASNWQRELLAVRPARTASATAASAGHLCLPHLTLGMQGRQQTLGTMLTRRPRNLPGTILVYTCYLSAIIHHTHAVHSQKCPGLGNKLNGLSNHSQVQGPREPREKVKKLQAWRQVTSLPPTRGEVFPF